MFPSFLFSTLAFFPFLLSLPSFSHPFSYCPILFSLILLLRSPNSCFLFFPTLPVPSPFVFDLPFFLLLPILSSSLHFASPVFGFSPSSFPNLSPSLPPFLFLFVLPSFLSFSSFLPFLPYLRSFSSFPLFPRWVELTNPGSAACGSSPPTSRLLHHWSRLEHVHTYYPDRAKIVETRAFGALPPYLHQFTSFRSRPVATRPTCNLHSHFYRANSDRIVANLPDVNHIT